MSKNNKMRGRILEALAESKPISTKHINYIFQCSIRKKYDNYSILYYDFNTDLLEHKPFQYIKTIYLNMEPEEKDELIALMLSIYDNMPAFPNPENRIIIVGRYKNINVKVDTWKYKGMEAIALIYLAKLITNNGFHSKYSRGWWRIAIKTLITLGVI